MNRVLVTIYIHPEFYPPTLYAINEFSKAFDEVIVVTRNLAKTNWDFPRNVALKASGNYISLPDSMRQPYLKKVRSFFNYLLLLYKELRSEKPGLVVVYDPIALFCYWLIRFFFKTFTHSLIHSSLLWYHNHDVIDKKKVGKFSIGWFAAKYEHKTFKNIDIFTLPSEDRKKFFPIEQIRGKYYFLPNLPPLSFYKQFYSIKQEPEKEIKLLYQGWIVGGHGLEEIITILNCAILSKSVSLTLLGNIKEDYKQNLMTLAKSNNVADKLFFLPRTLYAQLPEITRQYHIGIGTHKNDNIQYSTGGTASNKIYEYAALGLPVILYDDAQYRKYLDQYNWAYFTDLSSESILNCIEGIVKNHNELSKQAHNDFLNELNFEKHLKKITDNLKLN